MKNPALFYGGIALALVGIILGIFFLIPGIPHIVTDSAMHIKHALVGFALAVVGILAALVNRPRTGSQSL